MRSHPRTRTGPARHCRRGGSRLRPTRPAWSGRPASAAAAVARGAPGGQLVDPGHHDGPEDRSDQPAGPNVEAVAEQQADQDAADERTDEADDDGRGPVDRPLTAAEDQL